MGSSRPSAALVLLSALWCACASPAACTQQHQEQQPPFSQPLQPLQLPLALPSLSRPVVLLLLLLLLLLRPLTPPHLSPPHLLHLLLQTANPPRPCMLPLALDLLALLPAAPAELPVSQEVAAAVLALQVVFPCCCSVRHGAPPRTKAEELAAQKRGRL